jgi:hypothetical protein
MRSPLQLWCSSSGNVFENSSPSLAPTSIKNPFFYTMTKKIKYESFQNSTYFVSNFVTKITVFSLRVHKFVRICIVLPVLIMYW